MKNIAVNMMGNDSLEPRDGVNFYVSTEDEFRDMELEFSKVHPTADVIWEQKSNCRINTATYLTQDKAKTGKYLSNQAGPYWCCLIDIL